MFQSHVQSYLNKMNPCEFWKKLVILKYDTIVKVFLVPVI